MDATELTAEPAPRPVRFWVVLALIAAGTFVYAVLVNRGGGEPLGTRGPAIGRSLSYLRLEALTGDATAIELDDLTGHVTLLNYWGTWCPPCLREFPHIEELGREFGPQADFRLVAVSCGEGADEDLRELRERTQTYLTSRESTLATYADQNAASRRAMAIVLGLPEMAYPTTLVLDRQGKIRGFWQGYDRRAAGEMREVISQLLEPKVERDMTK